MRGHWLLVVLAVCVLGSVAQAADDRPILFSYFVGNGEDGLHLAWSEDGHTFRALNDGKPLIAPKVGESSLMRDPSIARGPDGTFHMVWTTGWKANTIGYAHSKDLIHWSEQRALQVMPKGEEVRNCWAPEVFYDEPNKRFVVVWASSVAGRFPETLDEGHHDYNHRLYAFTTKDFRDIGETDLFYNPGFQVIDGAIFRTGDRYAMVVKDETLKPVPGKYLFLTFSDSATGPWTGTTGRITGDYWAEGPSPIKIGEWWYIYFDKYRKDKFGAVRSKDLKNWQDVSEKVKFPEGTRHGTAFRVQPEVLKKLKQLTQ